MMKGKDRNAPCWCGSGKKFKKCHLNREAQEKENPWGIVETNRKAFQQKKCWACDAGLGPCEGRVIKAHTVSRGPNLSKIAQDGHVMHYTANIADMNKNGGKLSVKKIGTKDASVFNGFCSKHDRELFSCIENETFSGRPDQCLAVAYRTMSRELYGKDASSQIRETLRGADKGKLPAEQFFLQAMLEELNRGNEAAGRELKATHDELTKALVENRPEVLQSFVLEFEDHLPFMFAGAWSPFTDLHGDEIQVGYEDEILEQIFVSSFASTNGGIICLSWRDTSGAPGKVIAGQIEALPKKQIASACLQLVMKHVENVFFQPDWFEGLSDTQREQMDILAASGFDFLGSPPSAPVCLSMDFELPCLARQFEI